MGHYASPSLGLGARTPGLFRIGGLRQDSVERPLTLPHSILTPLYSNSRNVYNNFMPAVSGVRAYGSVMRQDPWSPSMSSSPMKDYLAIEDEPQRPGLVRGKITYSFKVGEFGDRPGQFSEPSALAVNSVKELIVADTNGHRIQVFNSHGQFIRQFGECGKEDGKLMYPNQLAVDPINDDIVLAQRKPAYKVQKFDRWGKHIRSFGNKVIESPRGICVDQWQRIFVVLGKVMKVVIFDRNGHLLHLFKCPHLEFPYSIAVDSDSDIYLADNHSSCIWVYNTTGNLLRQIGGKGMTKYPIGVMITTKGNVIIADNHNSFNLTVFSREGVLLQALESKVKHAQCYDMDMMDDNIVVFTSRDYRIYKYVLPQIRDYVASESAITALNAMD